MSSAHHKQDRRMVHFSVITSSDTRTQANDRSGQLIMSMAEAAGHTVIDYRIIPDDRDTLATAVMEADTATEVLVVTGGTGFAARDISSDVVKSLSSRPVPGFGELFRMLSYEDIGPSAMLSRAGAWIVDKRVVYVLPGSTAAVRLAMESLILPTAGHLVALVRPQPPTHTSAPQSD